MENANKGIFIIGRTPQRALRQYSGPKLIDLSGTRETKKGTCQNCSKYRYYTRDCQNRPREQRLNQRS